MKKFLVALVYVIVLLAIAIMFINQQNTTKEIKVNGVNTTATPYEVSSHRGRYSDTYTADFTYKANSITYTIESVAFYNLEDAEKYLYADVHARYLPKTPDKAILVEE